MTSRRSDRFRLVVFDVAGTTVLDGDAVVECLQTALRPHVDISLQDARDVMGLPKPVAISDLLVSRGPWRPGQLPGMVRRAHDAFRTAILARYRAGDGITPAPGALETFEALRRSGVKVALDTGFSRDILDALLNHLGWTQAVVDATVASDEVNRGRPHPDLIHRAMALTDVRAAGDVAKVGDTPVDLAEGLAAECGLVVGVTYGTHTRAQLERAGVTVIDALPELPALLGLEGA